MRWVRAVLHTRGLRLEGLTVVDGWDAAVMLVRNGEVPPPDSFWYPHHRHEASPSPPRSGTYRPQMRVSGGRRRFTAGHVAPENVEHFVKQWANLGLLVDTRSE